MKNPYLAKWRAKNRAAVDALKAIPCMDCGECFPAICMDFDHRPGTDKLFEVGDKIFFLGMKKLLDEIAKCDVVCSNCHRIRTQSRL